MSNEHMQVPTDAQEATTSEVLAQLDKTASLSSDFRRVIGALRDRLNEDRQFIERLKGVIGPQAYFWSRNGSSTSIHQEIDERLLKIAEALK